MSTQGERAGWLGVGAVWAIALAGSVLVLVMLAQDALPEASVDHGLQPYAALGVVLGVAVLASLVAQLASRRPEGFVVRVSASVGGAIALLAIAALGAALIG